MILKILQSSSMSLYLLYGGSVNTIKGTCFLSKGL